MTAAIDSILVLLNPTALDEMQDTLEEEKVEVDAVLGLVIVVVIGTVVVGLLVACGHFWLHESETPADLETQEKPGVQADLEAQEKPGVQKK